MVVSCSTHKDYTDKLLFIASSQLIQQLEISFSAYTILDGDFNPKIDHKVGRPLVILLAWRELARALSNAEIFTAHLVARPSAQQTVKVTLLARHIGQQIGPHLIRCKISLDLPRLSVRIMVGGGVRLVLLVTSPHQDGLEGLHE